MPDRGNTPITSVSLLLLSGSFLHGGSTLSKVQIQNRMEKTSLVLHLSSLIYNGHAITSCSVDYTAVAASLEAPTWNKEQGHYVWFPASSPHLAPPSNGPFPEDRIFNESKKTTEEEQQVDQPLKSKDQNTEIRPTGLAQSSGGILKESRNLEHTGRHLNTFHISCFIEEFMQRRACE